MLCFKDFGDYVKGEVIPLQQEDNACAMFYEDKISLKWYIDSDNDNAVLDLHFLRIPVIYTKKDIFYECLKRGITL